MNIKNEIEQINEIINRLDTIQDNEWQQKEDETLEEYNNRIEKIEKELEEELLDYISDSLLTNQDINEEELLEEAQEKIKNEYELFNDAFIKNENGKITLKSEEELVSLGYALPEEIEMLKEIEESINSSEAYINKIKESLQERKDIDAEIDRKMELVKAIISAKKRGENLPNSLNQSLEKDKFNKANEYIANTISSRKIPIIQREYVHNNYILERKYNNPIRTNINNNVGSRITTYNTPNVIIKEIPERKNILYTNFEKSFDKNNNLTKQKIKARIELKSIFKQNEGKELSKKEEEDLNSQIECIKMKYPNIIDDKIIKQFYDIFKIKLEETNLTKKAKVANIALGKLNVRRSIETTIKGIKEKSKKIAKNIVEPKETLQKSKMSKEELIKALKKAERFDTHTLHLKGINLLIINKLICYLKDNNDQEVQEKLNKEISKLQTDRHKNSNKLYIYNPLYTNIQILKYMYDCYKEGVKSTDGSREIIPVNQNAAAYYLYLAYNVAQDINSKENENDKKTIIEEFEKNKEETCYRYFEFLKEKYEIDKFTGIKRLKIEPDFMRELEQSQFLPNKTEYLDIAISKEFLSRAVDDAEDKNKKNQAKENSIYVCSDLHGEYPVYQAIISQLKENDKLYILGDVIDRGPDGIKILQDIMKRKQTGQVEFIIGNHELMMIKSLFLNDKNETKIWNSNNNSGRVTMEAFKKLSVIEQKGIRDFLIDSFVYKNINVNSQKVHLVHAKAIQDVNDNSDKTVREMLTEGNEKLMETAVWSRDNNFLLSAQPDPQSAKKGVFTVIGHSPTDNNMINYKNGYLNIDCGAGHGAIASLVNLTTGDVKYFSVNRERIKANNKQQEK